MSNGRSTLVLVAAQMLRLRKSVMVPIPRIVTKMVSAMMVFVAESTRRKFVMVRPPEHVSCQNFGRFA